MAAPNVTLPGPSGPKDVPGTSKSAFKKLLETGSNMVQSFKPINQVKTHLCGFAHYAHDPARQMELHHYCSALNDDVIQCAVYDSDEANARLIGVEYVITGRIFQTLPPEEQKLWHSHQYDILSGSFFAPGLPALAEKPLLSSLMDTYGKTWVFWQVDRGDTLPLGVPQLMMVATKDGEWNPSIFVKRDQRYGHSSAERVGKLRGDLPAVVRAK